MKWTKEEDEIIKEHYENSDQELILSLLPYRTWNSIQLRGKRTHGLCRLKFKVHYGHKFLLGKRFPYKPRPAVRKQDASFVCGRGYKFVKTEPDENGKQFYRREHVLLIEKEIGRKLEREGSNGEGVHHIDGDRKNNDRSNLYLYSNQTEHKKIHQSLQELGYELIRKGIIFFDIKDKKYKLKS